MTQKTNDVKTGVDGDVAIADLFGVKLQPWQRRVLGQMDAMARMLPDGCKVHHILTGRSPGVFAKREGKITHKWTGKEWGVVYIFPERRG